MAQTILCPRCGHENALSAVNCSSCRINLEFASTHKDEWNGAVDAAHMEEETKLAEQLQNIIVTTTPSIQGEMISRYLGVVSTAVVLGTGFLSELSANWTDLLGTRSGKFQEKLNRATSMALSEIRYQALQTGANAIVGLDLDYMITDKNAFVVTANGTAVQLAPQ